ncbi:DUF4342 domain-containing protein [Kallotenue papyrolyticum]|uniref:DUF4342 domain-containing protein n=1 Tax=Kallotenue papyrolyticum TaxID=1325125 RepID=UPI0004923F21|nr:DUF4342 domain-containing protein [Kallotenue papyrolyticum]
MSERPRDTQPSAPTWTEEIELAANQVIERVQQLIHEGNVRRLIVKHDGHVLLETPLTIAAIAGVAAMYAAPLLAALGALAGLVARVQIVIEREGERPEPVDITPAETRLLALDPTLETRPAAEAGTEQAARS